MFVFVICLYSFCVLCPMLPVHLDCQFLIPFFQFSLIHVLAEILLKLALNTITFTCAYVLFEKTLEKRIKSECTGEKQLLL